MANDYCSEHIFLHPYKDRFMFDLKTIACFTSDRVNRK